MGLFKKELLNVYRIEIYGMRCGMCESHVNTVIRNHFKVKKVTSSHSKNETLIYSKEELDIEEIKEVLKPTGYEIKEIKKI
ncbi:MAG: cation transporter [Bacilli bacterium]|nr:cation transporter [Bacilli bacterium]